MSITQALCAYNSGDVDLVFAAFKGLPGDDQLYYAIFDDSVLDSEKWLSLSPNQMTPSHAPMSGHSSVGPALATYTANGQTAVYAAWKGEHTDEQLYWAWYDDSQTPPVWRGQQAGTPHSTITGGSSLYGPSLAVFNDSLYAAWRGAGDDQTLWYAQFDGNQWSTPVQMKMPPVGGGEAVLVTSFIGPSLASFYSNLWAMWRGAGDDERIYFAMYDGANWTGVEQLILPDGAPSSSIGPSIAAVGDVLCVAWKGPDEDQGLWYGTYDGQSQQWWGPANIPGADSNSSLGPALVAVDNDQMYAMWKGAGNDYQLYFAMYQCSLPPGPAQLFPPLPQPPNPPGHTGQDIAPTPVPPHIPPITSPLVQPVIILEPDGGVEVFPGDEGPPIVIDKERS